MSYEVLQRGARHGAAEEIALQIVAAHGAQELVDYQSQKQGQDRVSRRSPHRKIRRSPRLFDSDPLRLQRFERRSGERFRGAS